MMKCLYCMSELTETTTTYFEEIGENFVIIKHVPCLKCENCGEIAYTLATLERIENIVDSLKQRLEEVNVVEYTTAA